MKIERVQGGSTDGRDTHKSHYYRHAFNTALLELGLLHHEASVVDPFARNCPWGEDTTNDIDITTKANHHQCGRDFLQSLPSACADVVLFDPPFSQRQAVEKYGAHTNLYTDGTYISDCMLAIERVLKPGGILLKLGFNSTRHRPTFELVRTWLVNFGGNRNDVIVTMWQMTQHTLREYGI